MSDSGCRYTGYFPSVITAQITAIVTTNISDGGLI